MIPIFLVAMAQAQSAPTTTVQVDPLTFALGYAHVQVEGTLSDSVTLYAGPHLRLFSAPGTPAEPYVGFGGEVGIRYYFQHQAPDGWWVLGRGVLAHVWATDSLETSPGGYASALGGYTGILGNGLVLSGGAGVQRIQYGVGDYGVRGWFPALHTAVGWAF